MLASLQRSICTVKRQICHKSRGRTSVNFSRRSKLERVGACEGSDIVLDIIVVQSLIILF